MCLQGNPGKSSWHLALPGTTAECGTTPLDVARIEAVFGGESCHQPVVGRHIVEDPDQESGFTRGRANLARADPCYGQKAAESLGIASDKRKGLNRKLFCLFP
jgi:hypothetical protein